MAKKNNLLGILEKNKSRNSHCQKNEKMGKKFEDGGEVPEGYTNISHAKPSKLTTRFTMAMRYPDKMFVEYDGKTIARFYYNMRGYNQDFWLKNKEGIEYGFPGDKPATTQLSNFKKALKDGYVFIRDYDAKPIDPDKLNAVFFIKTPEGHVTNLKQFIADNPPFSERDIQQIKWLDIGDAYTMQDAGTASPEIIRVTRKEWEEYVKGHPEKKEANNPKEPFAKGGKTYTPFTGKYVVVEDIGGTFEIAGFVYDDQDDRVPEFFETEADAQKNITELIDDVKGAVDEGDMEDEYDADEYGVAKADLSADGTLTVYFGEGENRDVIYNGPLEGDEDGNFAKGGTVGAHDIEDILKSYILAAFHSTDDGKGHSLEFSFYKYTISGKTSDGMRKDIKKFVKDNLADLDASGLSDGEIGNDFWLTRHHHNPASQNRDFWEARHHHGAGLQDPGLKKELADRLTKAAQTFSEGSIEIGKGNKLYYTDYAKGGKVDKGRIDKILNHYIATGLWTGYDEHDEPLDGQYNMGDIAPETMEGMRRDIEKFVIENNDLIEKSGLGDEQVGHDFWLTRHGHGSGFWDRDIDQEIGEKLTNAAKSFSEGNLEIGDDDKIHYLGYAKGGTTSANGITYSKTVEGIIKKYHGHINSKSDVENFYRDMVQKIELNVHPDDRFEDYVESDKAMFKKDQAKKLNEITDDCFAYCEKHGLDIYGIALKQMQKKLKKLGMMKKGGKTETGKMQKATFQLPESRATYVGYYNPKGGFSYGPVPHFTKDVLLRLLKSPAMKTGYEYSFKENGNLVFTELVREGKKITRRSETIEPKTMETDNGGKVLYEAGFGWAWDKIGEKFGRGGNVRKNVWRGRYVTLEQLPDRIEIELTQEGKEKAREEGIDDHEKFPDFFEDIYVNSSWKYFPDLGEAGLGMTSAPGFTFEYYYNDEGELEDQGGESELYYDNDYAIRDQFEKILESGEKAIFLKHNFRGGGHPKKGGPKGGSRGEGDLSRTAGLKKPGRQAQLAMAGGINKAWGGPAIEGGGGVQQPVYGKGGAADKFDDVHFADEIRLFWENDGQLYNSMFIPIMRNMKRKYDKGKFDVNLAAKGWMYFVEAADKKYSQEQGSRKAGYNLSVHDRKLLAKELAEFTVEEYKANKLESYDAGGPVSTPAPAPPVTPNVAILPENVSQDMVYKAGGPVRVANSDARNYSENQIDFKGNNLEGKTFDNGDYAVLSHGHYPLWYWNKNENKWYGNTTKVNNFTAVHFSQTRPGYGDIVYLDRDQLTLKMIGDDLKFSAGGDLAPLMLRQLYPMSTDNTTIAHAGAANTEM